MKTVFREVTPFAETTVVREGHVLSLQTSGMAFNEVVFNREDLEQLVKQLKSPEALHNYVVNLTNSMSGPRVC